MQIWPHSRMDWKKEIKRRGCVVLTHPRFFMLIGIEIAQKLKNKPLWVLLLIELT